METQTHCGLSEEDLLSGLDRESDEIQTHLRECPSCQRLATEYKASIHAVVDASRPPEPQLPSRIGPYVIRRRIGEGGMGIVYEAEQQNPKRLVALKVVRGGQFVDEYRLRMFEREAQTLGRLRHPAIAGIFEGGRAEDGQPFFAMELVRGVPLNEYVRQQEMPRTARLKLFVAICNAVNYAHQRGVIHRDLKPSNILIDGDGQPKVLDFGLARITEPDGALKTETVNVVRIMGTLPYMSPEEVRGIPEEIDTRSDVYSLGVVLYELLTGELPYTVRRAALPEAARIICEEPPRSPRTVDRSLPADIETIVLKAMEKAPLRRYQSVAALVDDIERFLADQPILARRASAFYHLRKYFVRHRLVAFFLFAMFCAITAVSVAFSQNEKYRIANVESALDSKDLAAAVTEARLARLLQDHGEFAQAEPIFDRAIDTFRRLGRTDYAAPAMVDFARLLLERDDEFANKRDLRLAESLLIEAIELIQETDKPDVAVIQRAYRELNRLYALAMLVYGPDYWDDAEELAEANAWLEELARSLEPDQRPR